jgi:hypothetical protein
VDGTGDIESTDNIKSDEVGSTGEFESSNNVEGTGSDPSCSEDFEFCSVKYHDFIIGINLSKFSHTYLKKKKRN